MTTATLIQTVATVESLLSPIDQLAVLDREQKALAAKVKTLKDEVANTYGEGKHRGEKYGVTVVIADVIGSVNYEALCKHFKITEEQLNSFRKEGSARITVTPTA
jgi:hypothetical protein